MRSQGMTKSLREELFAQRRLVRGSYEEASPTVIVNSAEGTAIFRGLNHSRNLMGPINEALSKIAQAPTEALTEYEAKLRAARDAASRDEPEHLS